MSSITATLSAAKVLDELLETATRIELGSDGGRVKLEPTQAIDTFMQDFIQELRARGYRLWNEATACPIDIYDIDTRKVEPGDLRDCMTARQIRMADAAELELGLLCGDYCEFLEFVIEQEECGASVEEIASEWREDHPGTERVGAAVLADDAANA